jgi:uncharacterized repeat protein (TIGR02059 family)
MAISFVAKGAFASGTTSASAAVPTNYHPGDLLIIMVHTPNNAVTTPAGWNLLAPSPVYTGTANVALGVRITVFWKIATASESSVSVAVTSGTCTCVQMTCWRGVDTTTPFDVTPTSKVDATSTTALSCPTITSATDGAMIINAIALDTDAASTANMGAATNASLASITEGHDQTVSTGTGGGIGFEYGIKTTAGAVNATTATVTTGAHAYLTIALRPATTTSAGTKASNSDGSKILLTYNKAMNDPTGHQSVYTVMVNGSARTVDSINLNANTAIIELVLASSIMYGDTVTVAYTYDVTKPIKSTDGGVANSFTALSVTNNVAPPPTLTNAGTSVDGTKIILYFDFSMANPAGKQAEFTVTVGGVGNTVTAAALQGGNNHNIELTLTTPITYGQTVTTGYTKGTVLSDINGILTSYSGVSVTNNAASPPTLVSYEIKDDGSKVKLKFSKTMADPSGKHTQFGMHRDGSASSFSSASLNIDTTIIELIPTTNIVYDEEIEINYTKGTILAADGGALQSITYTVVINTVPQLNPLTFTYKKLIAIDHTKFTANQEDFPITLILTSSNFNFAHTLSSGYDIIFKNESETLCLPFEREYYDQANQMGKFHIKIPNISSISDTNFYICYGNSSATDTQLPERVWSNGYNAVYHLGASLSDSTVNNYDLSIGSGAATITDEIYGKARTFNGTSDYLTVPANGIPCSNTESVHLAYWESVATDEVLFIDTDGACLSLYTGYGMILHAGTNRQYCSTVLSTPNWHITQLAYDSSQNPTYIADGTTRSTAGADGYTHTPANGCIGAKDSSGVITRYFKGKISELRFENIIRSTAWRNAERESINNNLLSLGSEIGSPPPTNNSSFFLFF